MLNHPTRAEPILNKIDASARCGQADTYSVLSRLKLKMPKEISNIDLGANVVESIAYTLGDFTHEC